MSSTISYNGVSYTLPVTGEEGWAGPTKVEGLLTSLATNTLTKAGGLWTLAGDADFGAVAGLKAKYFKSRSGSVAETGVFRLANSETFAWRNYDGDGDIVLSTDSSDNFLLNGKSFLLSGDIVNADINASAAIAYSKLNLATSIVNGDVATNAAIAYSKLNLSTSIVNGDVATTAAIARSKIATGTAYRVLANTSTGAMGENAALTATHVVYADSNGQLAGEATLSKSRGGCAADMSNVTFPSTGTIPTKEAYVAPTIQKFLSGSGTYTTRAGVLYLKVRMVGGGGGGGGSTAIGSTGGDTTFGSILTAGGGHGGTVAGTDGGGGVGGTVSVDASIHGLGFNGGVGQCCAANVANGSGGHGATSPFGGSGMGGMSGDSPTDAIANTGSGGGGCYYSGRSGGGGGGAGAYIDVIITSPSATYSYAVGAYGAGGTGTYPGSKGGSGLIIVEEHYQ